MYMYISVVKYLLHQGVIFQFILQYFPPPFSLPALSSSKVDEVVELFEESEVSTVLTHVAVSETSLVWTL